MKTIDNRKKWLKEIFKQDLGENYEVWISNQNVREEIYPRVFKTET